MKPKTAASAPTPSQFSLVGVFLRSAGLFLAATCVTARPLFPSEDASSGSGVTILALELSCGIFFGLSWLIEGLRPPSRTFALLWTLFLAAVWASALMADYRFPAIVMAWEWTGIAAVSLLIRQIAHGRWIHHFAELFTALLIGQTALSYWQTFYHLPELRQQYERKDPRFLAEMQQLGVVPGTASEARFRDRLFSSEPFGTLGHPNSLAGLITLGLPIVIAVAWPNVTGRRSFLVKAFWFIIAVAVVIVFVLTKCRSAWLAAVLAALAVGLSLRRTGWINWLSTHRRAFVVAGLALFAVAASAYFGGLVDRFIWSEIGKSFAYRLEWWQSTLPIIAERPLFGVGFGNFRSYYLTYKLPFSSEEIQDPHNFLLELWSCTGLFGLLAYLALLSSSLIQAFRHSSTSSSSTDQPDPVTVALAYAAALLLVSTLIWGLSVWINPLVFLVAGMLVWFLPSTGPIARPPLRVAALIAVVGLHIHLLAAGGISFPGLMLPCWALFAVQSNPLEPTSSTRSAERFWGLLPTIACLGLLFLFSKTLLQLLLKRDQILSRSRATGRIEDFELAAKLLPSDQTGWVLLAQARAHRLRTTDPPSQADYQVAEDAWRKTIDLDPRRSANFHALGKLYWLAAEFDLDAQALEKAVDCFTHATHLYPNSAALRWESGYSQIMLHSMNSKADSSFLRRMAIAGQRLEFEPADAPAALELELLADSGRTPNAVFEFRRALELDQTPHPDRKLTSGQRWFARLVADGTRSE